MSSGRSRDTSTIFDGEQERRPAHAVLSRGVRAAPEEPADRHVVPVRRGDVRRRAAHRVDVVLCRVVDGAQVVDFFRQRLVVASPRVLEGNIVLMIAGVSGKCRLKGVLSA